MASGRWRVHAGWLAVVLLAIVGTYWAVSSIARPQAANPDEGKRPTYTVSAGEIGVQTQTQAELTFGEGQTVRSGKTGTITSVDLAPTAVISAGSSIGTVNLRPMIAAQGAVPAFRDMSIDLRGPDVAQLRAFLGLAEGDLFSAEVRDAVRTWQAEHGFPVDGIVQLGDIVFVSALPATAQRAEGFVLGAPIAAGDSVLVVLEARPQVGITADNGGQLTAGLAAHITLPDSAVASGTLQGPSTSTTGLKTFTVVAPDGTSACDDACAAQIAGARSSVLPAVIDVVPVASGLVVPDAAIAVQPDGTSAVQLTDGSWRTIEVQTRGQGTSIVTGVDEGQQIYLFADEGKK